ncbi:MAG: trypsin-like peptidase domain-containing protein [Deltaproteobacteria bacterium]|nr:trypsin-like peptidase domain-containing protein [Deltaproteobacteria bacterium]
MMAYGTVRLECERADGTKSTGTGFFFHFARKGDGHVPTVITNKHVVEGAKRGKFLLTRLAAGGGPQRGSTLPVVVDDFEKQWIAHPDPAVDLCVMPIAPLVKQAEQQQQNFFTVPCGIDLIPSDSELQDLDQIENVTMVGYPNGLWDQTHNMPVFRRGITATHPALDWNGKPEFMIDAACFPGSSGSPVFLYDKSGYVDRRGTTVLGAGRLKLLGVLYAGPQHIAGGAIVMAPAPTSLTPTPVTPIPLNLGLVVKAKTLHAFEAQFAALNAGAG